MTVYDTSRPHRRAADMTRDIPRVKGFRPAHALPDEMPVAGRLPESDAGLSVLRPAVSQPVYVPTPPPFTRRPSRLALIVSNLRGQRWFRRG